MKNIKLIVSDMDGTLLHSDHTLSPKFNEIYQQLRLHDILFVPASGRQYYSIVNYFKNIKDELSIIAENGTYVTHKGQEIFIDELDNIVVNKIIEKARKMERANIVLASKNAAYVESTDPIFLEFFKNYYSKSIQVEDLTNIPNEKFIKIAINNPDGSEKNLYHEFLEFEKYGIKVVVSGEVWLDIMNSKSNKGVALKILIEKLNIHPEEIMAFGDFLNDIEMLELAKYSFAMENAHAVVKENAAFIAPSNDQDGVLQIIKRYLNTL